MNKECVDCDSTSMEMCLLVRHCPHFIKRRFSEIEDVKMHVDLDTKIEVIGTQYNCEDMMVDLVEACKGFYITDNDGNMFTYERGCKFKDGNIIDCFVHHESDCIFMVCECNGVYFIVYFEDWERFSIIT